MSESFLYNILRVTASKVKARLFRNNIGGYKTEDGRYIKYGLCHPGGSDLVGFTEVVITREMLGRTIAVFTAIEVKGAQGRVHEAQEKFIDAVQAAGGIAAIVTGESDMLAAIKEFREY